MFYLYCFEKTRNTIYQCSVVCSMFAFRFILLAMVRLSSDLTISVCPFGIFKLLLFVFNTVYSVNYSYSITVNIFLDIELCYCLKTYNFQLCWNIKHILPQGQQGFLCHCVIFCLSHNRYI